MKFLAKSDVYGPAVGVMMSQKGPTVHRYSQIHGSLYEDESTNKRMRYNMEKRETAVNHEERRTAGS